MRPSILANLAKAAQKNADHGAEEVRLFEVGPIYLGDGPKDQRTVVAGLVRPRPQRHWSGDTKSYDTFSAKADVFAVLQALDQPGERFQIAAPDAPHWHPGQAATLKMGPKNVVGAFGQLHPKTLKELDIEGPVFGFEIILEALPVAKSKGGKTKARLEKADLTPIRRDFAFLADADTPAGDIARIAGAADKKLITAARVFDVYDGQGTPDGKKSVAIEVTLQPKETALKDEDIEKVSRAIVAAVAKGTKAELRS
jgi:phenylalanyl-tRNA synthetase beta chain